MCLGSDPKISLAVYIRAPEFAAGCLGPSIPLPQMTEDCDPEYLSQ